MRDYGEVESADLDAERIISTVCDFFKVDREDLLGKKKNKEIVEPRQLCMYLIYDMLNIPLLVHIPGLGESKTIHTTCGQIDIMPTILNLMGIENDSIYFEPSEKILRRVILYIYFHQLSLDKYDQSTFEKFIRKIKM